MTDDFQKLYDRTLRFLSYRPRSEKEIRDYLQRPPRKRFPSKQKPIDETIIEKIIAKLKDYKFIDDEEFTKWWIEQRIGARPKGFRLIKLELQQKGIDKETIEKILGDYDTKILSDEGAKRLLVKILPRHRLLPKQELYQKLSQFLMRRGFDWETIKEAIDGVLKKEYNTKQ